MACSFGWDWGPDLRTAGMWTGRVERWSIAGWRRYALITVEDTGTGRVELQVEIERLDTRNPLSCAPSLDQWRR